MQITVLTLLLTLLHAPAAAEGRVWRSSFEDPAEYTGFYVEASGHRGSTYHGLSTATARSGQGHWARITRANPKPWPGGNTNHRGYPTVQLHRLPGGGFRTPALVELWVRHSFELQSPLPPPRGVGAAACEWISYATLSFDASDRWKRTLLLNQGWEGTTTLMHLRRQGDKAWSFQAPASAVPAGRWARLTLWVDADPKGGRARAWVDGRLVSEGPVLGGRGRLEQAHFGLYADPDCARGELWNDDIAVYEAGSFPPPPEGDAFLPPQPARP